MSEEAKICPFMSRPYVDVYGEELMFFQRCLGQECKAWLKEREYMFGNGCRLIP